MSKTIEFNKSQHPANAGVNGKIKEVDDINGTPRFIAPDGQLRSDGIKAAQSGTISVTVKIGYSGV